MKSLMILKQMSIQYKGKCRIVLKFFLGYTNGAYLFDLINICGLDLYEKGMSLEEELQKPRDIADFAKDIMLDKRGPTLLKDYYFFGESFINGTVFAFDKEEKVIEFKEGSLRKIREFNNLDALLEQVFKVGQDHYKNRMFIDFS